MLRRPPGHVAPQRSKYFLALAILVLPWLPLADAQQQHKHDNDHAASNIAATPLTGQQVVETPRTPDRRKIAVSRAVDTLQQHHQNYDAIINSDDASAAAPAVAPDLSVRAPGSSLAKADSSYGVGGLSPHTARSLEDWELKDFVLLATVDGDLYASDRKTGQERWHLKADRPMVQTLHFRANHSVVDEDYDPIDHYVWVVEPTRDGELYLWRPNGSGLTKMDWTIKNMVETLSPHNDIESDIVYTGSKETTIIVLDAETGTVMKEFGPSSSFVNKIESCVKPNALAEGESEECTDRGSITLARTEYTVSIHRYKSGSAVASLKYSEWGTNTFDNDLIRQAIITKDNCYVSGQHDGLVYGFDYERFSEKHPVFKRRLSSPVARVFDVLHRWDSSDGDLVALPQPPIPPSNEDSLRLRNEKVFINQTEEGGWYALSGSRYPLIVQADTAKVYSGDRRGLLEQLSELVGTHQLPSSRGQQLGGAKANGLYEKKPYDTIDPPKNPEPGYPLDGNNTPLSPATQEPNTMAYAAKKIGLLDLLDNPTFITLGILAFLWMYGESLRRRIKQTFGGFQKGTKEVELTPIEPTPETPRDSSPEVPAATPLPETAKADNTVTPATTTDREAAPRLVPEPAAKPRSPSVSFVEPSPPAADKASGDSSGEPGAVSETPKAKKKAHRGRRGGVKHKKANGVKREQSQSIGDEPDEKAVEEVVNQTVKFAGPQPKLEPDITTVNYGGVDEVSGPILKMDSLEVNLEHQLGIGSNGTIVFAGKWDGRDVAVKRMLVQFNEIATHETNLLRMSDDHANVIRYYAQQQRAGFLYIALELCQASLADVIQKPQNFRELAQAGERNLPHVLYQIASGLSHLHDLRIVHRDLKPQNILVNMGKNGHPRLLVSDFGLCKKLEGGQSSFGATTAHAAGTTGWRAPELLLDDDNPGAGAADSMTLTDPGSSMPSGSGSFGPGGANNSRRVTRAIDIFSLGLVFFYVLTKGNHPFDCGDRYMREVNIRKGAYNLDLLESLGDFAYEARELIGSMLNANPKLRPTVKEVMAHPFFWDAKKRLQFLVDVSDYFEKEPRDPPSEALAFLEAQASNVIKGGDFLKLLPKDFVDSLGKQRKYTGGRMLDLLRALRNKKNHYEDMSESLQKTVGPLPDGYLGFWTRRFPSLLIACWNVIYELGLEEHPRFRDCYQPARPELV